MSGSERWKKTHSVWVNLERALPVGSLDFLVSSFDGEFEELVRVYFFVLRRHAGGGCCEEGVGLV